MQALWRKLAQSASVPRSASGPPARTASFRPRMTHLRVASRLNAALAAVIIVTADRALQAKRRSVPVAALLDEPAHAATTVLLLSALGYRLSSPFAKGAVAASVAIDLDHLPQYLGSRSLTKGTPRPYPHSFITLTSVGLLALACRGRSREVALGAEFGLVGHFFRDMAASRSRGGLALFWPLSYANLRLPYRAYPVAMGAALVAAVTRTRSAAEG